MLPQVQDQKTPLTQKSGVGEKTTRERLAESKIERQMKKKPELENVKYDFFKLKPNSLVDYGRTEYVINEHFQNYLSEKINKYRFAGISFKTVDDSLYEKSKDTQDDSTLRQQEESNIRVAPKAGPFERSPIDQSLFDQNSKVLFQRSEGAQIKAFQALQKVVSPKEQLQNEKFVQEIADDVDRDFKHSQLVSKTQRTSLYSTIIDNNKNMAQIYHSSIQYPQQTGRYGSVDSPYAIAKKFKNAVLWNKKGQVSSSRHLMPFTNGFNAVANIDEASYVYLPSDRRSFFKRKAKSRLPLLEQRKLRLDQDKRSKSREKQQQTSKLPSLKGSLDVESMTNSTHKTQEKLRNNVLTPQADKNSVNKSAVSTKSQGKNTFMEIKMTNLNQKDDQETLGQGSSMVEIFEDHSSPVQKKLNKNVKGRNEKRKSFNMCQTKFQDVQKMYRPVVENRPTLNDISTINKMRQAKRYPIPESILHKPQNFELQIDSLMHEAYNSDDKDNEESDLDAPYNSQESVEQIEFYSSSEEEYDQDEENIVKVTENRKLASKTKIKHLKLGPLLQAIEKLPNTRDQLLKDTKLKKIKIHEDAIKLNGFNLDNLKVYPSGQNSGDIPTYLINIDDESDQQVNVEKTINNYLEPLQQVQGKSEKHLIEIFNVHKNLNKENIRKNLIPSAEHYQLLYQNFCDNFKSVPLDVFSKWQNNELKLVNYKLNMQQTKAIACMIPILKDLHTLELVDNQLKDEQGALLVLAAFLNPTLKSVKIEGQSNNIRMSTANTMRVLMNLCPDKITDLHLSNVQLSGSLDYAIQDLKQNTVQLQSLDLSCQLLSGHSCQTVQKAIIYNSYLKQLNLMKCNIGGFSMSMIMDGLVRNQGLQSVNLAHNSMASKYYEHSVKMASVLARHCTLMHADLSAVNITKEEVIFIGMSLPQSQSMMAVHLSGNGLAYYERVFLRTLIDAKCSAQFRKIAQSKMAKQYKPVDKRNLFAIRGDHETFQDELDHFLQAFAHVENLRLSNYDEAFEKLTGIKSIEEQGQQKPIDMLALFDQIRKAKSKKATTQDKNDGDEARILLSELISKITASSGYMIQQADEAERIVSDQIKLSKDTVLVQDLIQMGLQKEQDSELKIVEKQEQKPSRDLETKEENSERFMIQNMLKIDRIKSRVQQDALKQLKSKSAAEIAIMFQGIGRIAYDILQENPMQTYMNEVVFSRIIGHEEIEDAEVWKDSSYCWVCEKWNKHTIDFQLDYINNMKQNIQNITELDQVLQKCLHKQNWVNLQPVDDISKLNVIKADSNSEDSSDETNTDDKIYTESIISSPDDSQKIEETSSKNIQMRTFQEANPINSVIFDQNSAKLMLPQNHLRMKDITRPDNLSESEDEKNSSDGEVIQRKPIINKQHKSMALRGKSSKSVLIANTSSKNQQRKFEIKLDSSKNSNKKKIKKNSNKYQKEDGKLYRKVIKEYNLNGTKYQFEDEELVNWDSESEIETSDDDYHTSGFVTQIFQNRVAQKVNERTSEERARIFELQKLLQKNAPKVISKFGRKQVFVCASFNDWVPIELKTLHEMKLEKTKGEGLWEYVKECHEKQGQGLKHPTKDSNNILGVTQFLPPGRHFFYFIQDHKNLCLSNQHNIVRMKGTNVFLNEFFVNQRQGLPKQEFTDRKTQIGEDDQTFNKMRSVFKTYQEDDEYFCKKMLNSDIKYSKIQRFLARIDCAQKVFDVLEKNYDKIKNIFLYYIANSKSYPRLSQQDFNQFCQRTKLFCRNFTLQNVDKQFLLTNASINSYKNSEDRELNRYEFIEILLRIAKIKYVDPRINPQLDVALQNMLTKDLFPIAKVIDGSKFRQNQMYTKPVDEILSKNKSCLTKLYNIVIDQYQKTTEAGELSPLKIATQDSVESMIISNTQQKPNVGITMQGIQDFVTMSQINVKSTMRINQIYVESLMSRIDTMADPQKASNCMKFNEFLVFIARVAHELYAGTEQEQEVAGLHKKIDSMLGPILRINGLEQEFTFQKDDSD